MLCKTYAQVLLKTAILTVHSNPQISMDENILLNERAQCSFISEGLAEQLELKQKGTEVIYFFLDLQRITSQYAI